MRESLHVVGNFYLLFRLLFYSMPGDHLMSLLQPPQEQGRIADRSCRIADLASRVKVPPEAPRVRDWFVNRKVVVSQACDLLGVGGSTMGCSRDPRMVGLAGPSGVGKSTAASMVIRREAVRAFFCKGVLWLQVGQGAENNLPELMLRLAAMVYEIVMLKACRPPREQGIENDPEDGAAYIREVVDDSSQCFLVVADDVWNVKVLEELKSARMWVLYTTRRDRLLSQAPLLRLDEVQQKEAELVLRRAAELHDSDPLPEAAYDLMRHCKFVVLDLALVGRWSVVRRRSDEKAWRAALRCILEAQKGGDGGDEISWRAAVLRAGLEELACGNPHNKELYLALAVIPKGLAFPSEVAAVLLYGDNHTTQDLQTAEGIAATLERWSILTLESGCKYRLHDEHADFIRGCFTACQGAQGRVLPRWRKYIASVRALLTFSSAWLVEIWEVWALIGREDIPLQPYDAGLGAMHPLSVDYLAALKTAAVFHWLREDYSEAYSKYSGLLVAQERSAGDGKRSNVANTLRSLGVCAYSIGKLEEAEGCFRRAIGIWEEELNMDNPDVATTLHNLGVCIDAAGRKDEATGFYRRALAIREEMLGSDHPDVANTLHCLGVCTGTAGSTEEGDQTLRRALSIREEKLGIGHPDVARTLYSLGVSVGEAGRTDQAEGLYRRALAIQEEKLGIDHLDVALTLHGLAVCVDKGGRAREAEELYRRALVIREEKLGAYHQDVARTLQELGVCLCNAGRMKEAEELFRRALAIREEKLGVDQPDVANTLHNLGVCLSNAGRTEEAEICYRRALAIEEESLGTDHVDVASTLHELGGCAASSKRGQDAEALFRRALAIREKRLSVDHPDTGSTLHELGVCLATARRRGEADEFLRRALAVEEGILGVDHLDLAQTLHEVGVNAFKLGKKETAEEYFRRALVIQEGKLGVDDPKVANTLHGLGMCACESGRTMEAETLYRRALAIEEHSLGVDLKVTSTLDALGVCLYRAGKVAEAGKFFGRALAIREENLGADHLDVASTLFQLGKCASKMERVKEAEELYRRALVIYEEQLSVPHPDVARTRDALEACAATTAKTDPNKFHRAARPVDKQRRLIDNSDASSKKTSGEQPDEADEIVQRVFGRTRQRALAYGKQSGAHSPGGISDGGGGDNPAATALRRPRARHRSCSPGGGVGDDPAAIALRRKPLDMAKSLHERGVGAFNRRMTEEAEELYGRALAIREKELGADHPDVASTLYCLGVCTREAGKTGEADMFLRRALAIHEEVLGVDHPNAKLTRDTLEACAGTTARTEPNEFQRPALSVEHGRGVVEISDASSLPFRVGVTTRAVASSRRRRPGLSVERSVVDTDDASGLPFRVGVTTRAAASSRRRRPGPSVERRVADTDDASGLPFRVGVTTRSATSRRR